MARRWIFATILFALAIGGMTAAWIAIDRRDAVQSRQDITLSLARLIAAHGEAAIGDAEKVVLAMEDQLTAWNLRDPQEGQALFLRFQKLMAGSPHITAGWVLDERGITVLDTRSYPPQPINGTGRAYFVRHRTGSGTAALIGAEARPGAISGREHFTYSKAQRYDDGRLKSVLVIGIYSDHFDALYNEVAIWPGSTAGFYDGDGKPLAQTRGAREPPGFVAGILKRAAGETSGSAVVEDSGQKLIAAWRQSTLYPQLLAVTSQSLRGALGDWRDRSIALAAIAVVLIGGFAGFALVNVRMDKVRQEVALNDLAMREVYHRVKNGLQMVISMINLRAMRQSDPALKTQLEEIATRVHAVADVQALLQNAQSLERLEVAAILAKLCDHLQQTYAGRIELVAADEVMVDTDTATKIAIITNELATNGMKHARSRVTLSCRRLGPMLRVEIGDDGPGVAPDFSFDTTNRFGLRTARLMAGQIGATLILVPAGESDGTLFRLSVPLG